MSEYIRVNCRQRPSKLGKEKSTLEITSKTHLKLRGEKDIHFDFDHVFDANSRQEDVYSLVGKRVVEGSIDGQNGTVFAYGLTGSGKTHTMIGPSTLPDCFSNPEHKGLIPRAVEHLFELLELRQMQMGDQFRYEVAVSFVELYNEEWFDLLDSVGSKLRLRVNKNMVFLQGASMEQVHSPVDVLRVLKIGWDSRHTAETQMNRASSRSHAVFMIDILTEECVEGVVNKKTARLNLVDLAGSERVSQTGAAGERFAEACSINHSLSILSRVIRQLSEKKSKDSFVPYRDSALTHFLKDSIGGNARTAVIVNVHPEFDYYVDTKSTLQFAERCRLIKNNLQRNEAISGDSVLALENKIKLLTNELRTAREDGRREVEHELESLRVRAAEADQWRQLYEQTRGELEKSRLMLRLEREKQGMYTNKENLNVTCMADEELEQMVEKMGPTLDPINEDVSKEKLNQKNMKLKFDLEQLRSENAELKAKRNEVSVGTPSTTRKRENPVSPFVSPSRVNSSKKQRRRTMHVTAENVRQSLSTRQLKFEEDEEENDDVPMHMQQAEQGILEEEGALSTVDEQREHELEMANNQLTQLLESRDKEIIDLTEENTRKTQEYEEELRKWNEKLSAYEDSAAQQIVVFKAKEEEVETVMATVKHMMTKQHALQKENEDNLKQLYDAQTELENIRAESEQNRILIDRKTKEFEKACRMKDALERNVAEVQEKLEKGNMELNNLSSSNTSLMNERSELQERLIKSEEAEKREKEKVESLKEELERLKKEKEENEKEAEKLKIDIVSLREELSLMTHRLEVQSERIERELEQRKHEMDIVRAGKELSEKQLSDALQSKKLLEATIVDYGNRIESLTNELAEKKREVNEKLDSIDQLSADLSRLEQAKKTVEEHARKDLAEQKAAHDVKLKDTVARHAEDIDNLNTLKNDLEVRLEKESAMYMKRMDEIAEHFKIKESRLTMDVQQRSELLQEQVSGLQQEIVQLEEKNVELENGRSKLVEEKKVMEKELQLMTSEKQRADEELVVLGGQGNPNNKVQLMERYRTEIVDLKKDKMIFQEKLAKALAEVNQLKTGRGSIVPKVASANTSSETVEMESEQVPQVRAPLRGRPPRGSSSATRKEGGMTTRNGGLRSKNP